MLSLNNLRCLVWPILSFIKQSLLFYVSGGHRYLGQIINQVAEIFESASLTTDFEKASCARCWVNENSVHLIDSEHDTYAFKIHKVVKLVWEFSRSGEYLPHLSCGPRAYLLKYILDRLGFRTRIIDVMEIDCGVPKSHTLLEYFDKDMNKWVMQDPDFNAVYVRKGSGVPMGAKEALSIDTDNMTYLCDVGKVENLENLVGTIEDYFDLIVLYRYSYVGGRSTSLFKNESTSNIRLSNNQSFSQYIAARDFNPYKTYIT